MELDFLRSMLEEGGYAGLFLWILVGASTLPVPNELIMMTLGLAASQSPASTIPIFLTGLAGVLVAVTGSYLLGRLLGRPLLRLLDNKKQFSRKLESSQRLMDKYHGLSLSISYFVPGARSLIPFLYGFSKLSFKKFMLFAYTGAAVWLLIMFTIGYLFGENIDVAAAYTGEIAIIAGVIIAIIVMAVKHRRKKLAASEEETIITGALPAIHEGSPE